MNPKKEERNVNGNNVLQAFVVLCIAALVLVVAGCAWRSAVNSKNPQVIFANTLLAASDAVDSVATGLDAANEVIEKLKTTEPGYYNNVKPVLVKVAKANDKAIAAIRSAKAGDASVDWRAAIVAVADAAGQQDLAAFGFKNPNSQAAVKIAFASLQAALVAIPKSFGK